MTKKILVTGGAGYVGAVLVPKLLKEGFEVVVLDLYIYGDDVLSSVKGHPHLQEIKGDLRNEQVVRDALKGVDTVIHLACISNDPSYELNPTLGKSINYDAMVTLVDVSKELGVKRFVYASSSSVYGVKEEENVSEDLPLEPLTDYSKYKALGEEYLLKKRSPGFVVLILRPATVCGYSPRLRLDLSVNILTNHAVNKQKITVFGGAQKRPNIHIEDMTDLYVQCMRFPDEKIDGKIFNAGYQNLMMQDIAEVVKNTVKRDMGFSQVDIVTSPTDDNRSYHISSDKIKRELGFVPKHTIEDAVHDLCVAFNQKKITESFNNIRYFNIKTMQAIDLK